MGKTQCTNRVSTYTELYGFYLFLSHVAVDAEAEDTTRPGCHALREEHL